MRKGLFMCLVMLVIATTTYAVGIDTGVSVKALANKKIQITVPAQANNTTLEMYDGRGKTLFGTTITSDESEKVIDLKNLPAGQYTIKSNDGVRVTTFLVAVSEMELTVGNHQVKFLPTVMLRDQSLYVNVLPNLGKVNMSITDEENRVICEKVVDASKSKGLIFDFSKSPKSDYTIWLSTNDFETTQKVTIN